MMFNGVKIETLVITSVQSYQVASVGSLYVHEERKIESNPVLTVGNRSHVYATFTQLERFMIETKIAAGIRSSNIKFRDEDNVVFGVIVELPFDQVNELRVEHPNTWTDDIMKYAIMFSDLMINKFGFEPMSIDLHLDEGDIRDGKFVEHIHMHINFFNFDFEKLVQPITIMKRHDFTVFQDLASVAFSPLDPNWSKEHFQRYQNYVKEHLVVNGLSRQHNQDFDKSKDLQSRSEALRAKSQQLQRKSYDFETKNQKLQARSEELRASSASSHSKGQEPQAISQDIQAKSQELRAKIAKTKSKAFKARASR